MKYYWKYSQSLLSRTFMFVITGLIYVPKWPDFKMCSSFTVSYITKMSKYLDLFSICLVQLQPIQLLLTVLLWDMIQLYWANNRAIVNWFLSNAFRFFWMKDLEGQICRKLWCHCLYKGEIDGFEIIYHLQLRQ